MEVRNVSEIEVTVEPSTDPATENVGDAIDHAINNEQSLLIGNLIARVEAIETQQGETVSKVAYHDDLITLHDHSEFVSQSDLTECEDRLAGMIQSLEPVSDEVAPTPEPESESTESSDESKDTPPNSRKNRKSIAERYYGR